MPASSPQACAADFTAALIGRDLAAALELLGDDVVFFYSNGSVIAGKDAFSATMTANWKMVSDYRYETLDQTWIAQSDRGTTCPLPVFACESGIVQVFALKSNSRHSARASSLRRCRVSRSRRRMRGRR